MMQRHFFKSGDLRLSYLDSGNNAPLIVALHALWMQGVSFQALAARLFPQYRVVALDQRGHGYSHRSSDYSRAAFVGDIAALLDHLAVVDPVVLLGNSLGGTNAFQFAARYANRVSHLINEEGPVVENYQFDWLNSWRGFFDTKEEFAAAAGPLYWSLEPSLCEVTVGYKLSFDIDDIAEIQRLTNGNWWADWQASKMPALVIRGTNSRAVHAEVMEEMARLRPNTTIVAIEAGHVMHEDNVAATAKAIKDFLQSTNKPKE